MNGPEPTRHKKECEVTVRTWPENERAGTEKK